MAGARLVRSFAAAFAGLYFIAQSQLNWRIHCLVACIALSLGLLFRIEPWEWALLALAIGGVLSLEAVNTAIEATIDALPGGWSEDKRQAKDTAAAAVLVAAVAALGLGAALFFPRVLQLLRPIG